MSSAGAPQTVREVTVRAVVVPLRRPLRTGIGDFAQWPLLLVDLATRLVRRGRIPGTGRAGRGRAGHGAVGRAGPGGGLLRVTPTGHWLEWQDWTHPILARPFEIRAGHLHPPDVPGNGLAWDEDAVAGYAIEL